QEAMFGTQPLHAIVHPRPISGGHLLRVVDGRGVTPAPVALEKLAINQDRARDHGTGERSAPGFIDTDQAVAVAQEAKVVTAALTSGHHGRTWGTEESPISSCKKPEV